MDLMHKRIGFALTGSFCTFDKVLPAIETLVKKGADVVPIVSFHVAEMDTRFNVRDETMVYLEETTGHNVLDTLNKVEPIGPKKLLDLLIVAPCTGNTLGKIANGISDTPVTLAVKSHLRNQRPVLIAVSSNDALSMNARNLGLLLNAKNIFFVPFRQDNHVKKSNSLVADMGLTAKAAECALKQTQMQPLLLAPKLPD